VLAAFCALLAAFLRAVSELLTTQLLRFRRDMTSGVATEVVEALRREEAAKAKAAKEAEAAWLTAQVKGDTLEEIAANNNCRLEAIDEVQTDLVCIVCEQHREGGRAGMGVFKTNNLSNLRRRLVDHMRSRHHKVCADKAAAAADRTVLRRRAGMNVGLAVYFCIKDGLSQLSFERLLLLLHMCGSFTGTVNNSRQFARSFLSHVYNAVQGHITRFLNTPQPVLGGRLPPFVQRAEMHRATGRAANRRGSVRRRWRPFMQLQPRGALSCQRSRLWRRSWSSYGSGWQRRRPPRRTMHVTHLTTSRWWWTAAAGSRRTAPSSQAPSS
jgi:hypothetical protein